MIVDHLTYAYRFFDLHNGFKQAFEFIDSYKTPLFESQRIQLAGPDLIAIIEPAQGKGKSAARLEAHRKYIDIQYIYEGREEIGWKPYQDCHHLYQSYNAEKDIEFFSDESLVWLSLKAGSFAIFFPNDAHAPLGGTQAVKKIIMKVAVEDTVSQNPIALSMHGKHDACCKKFC